MHDRFWLPVSPCRGTDDRRHLFTWTKALKVEWCMQPSYEQQQRKLFSFVDHSTYLCVGTNLPTFGYAAAELPGHVDPDTVSVVEGWQDVDKAS